LADGPALELAGVDFVVVEGPDRGKRVRVSQGRARIGTGSGCTLRLADPAVSRLHCEVLVRRDGASIVDPGSTNGTFVDGIRVRDADLSAGATLRLGSTTLRVEIGDEPTYVPVSDKDRLCGLVGGSVAMRQTYALIERAARTDATVLVQGETGTGKELVARAIRELSARAARPFVTVDCGAIAENLIESELFGHVRGAFSGAVSDRAGVFEEADGGTLFFDEIGELPLSLQPKLLRALELREIRRVGGNAVKKVDVRVIAATNRSLAASVNGGAFREDLYYRFAVVEIELPPLRTRREDIAVLAQHFYEKITGIEAPLPPELEVLIQGRAFPGNVRELRNLVERAITLGLSRDPPRLRPAVLPPLAESLVPINLPLAEAREAWVQGFESAYVRALLKHTKGNVTRAAERAGTNRRLIQRMMTRAGISSRDFNAADDD
jgi:transcriptional regulator with GAF, ATPase, and Fis domain